MRQPWFITSLLKAVTVWGAHTELCSQANYKPNANNLGENERNNNNKSTAHGQLGLYPIKMDSNTDATYEKAAEYKMAKISLETKRRLHFSS